MLLTLASPSLALWFKQVTGILGLRGRCAVSEWGRRYRRGCGLGRSVWSPGAFLALQAHFGSESCTSDPLQLPTQVPGHACPPPARGCSLGTAHLPSLHPLPGTPVSVGMVPKVSKWDDSAWLLRLHGVSRAFPWRMTPSKAVLVYKVIFSHSCLLYEHYKKLENRNKQSFTKN